MNIDFALNTLSVTPDLVDLSKLHSWWDVENRIGNILFFAKQNFRTLSKRYHPDNQKTGDRSKFELVKECYDLIKNLKITLNPYYTGSPAVGIKIMGDNLIVTNSGYWTFSI